MSLWDGDEVLEDSTGIVTDSLADHPGTFARGYHVGSLTEGLVAYYPMEEGQGQVLHDGALDNLGQINGASWNGSGQVGADALSFDGNDVVDTPIDSLDSPLTISAWVQFDDLTTNRYIISNFNTTNSDIYIRYQNTNDILEFAADDGSGTFSVTGFTNPSTGVWYHIVGVIRPDGTRELFVDGVSQASNSASTTTYDSGVTYKIGKFGSTNDYHSGLIDDVRIYNRALSQPEVSALAGLTEPQGREVTESDVPNADDSGVSRYAFENDVTDSWGTNDGTDNTSAGFSEGVYGQAKDFDGTDDRVELPDFGLGSASSFSISAWVRPDASAFQSIVARYDGTDDMLTLGTEDSGIFNWRLGHVGGNEIALNFGSYSTGNWYHVVGVWDAGTNTSSGYVDGQLEDRTSATIDDFATADGPWVGARTDGGQYMDGAIDDVRIYDDALSPREVESLHNLGAWRINRGDVI